MEEVKQRLEIVESKECRIKDPVVLIGQQAYLAQDYGIKTTNDTNMCFYLCIEGGDPREADVLKDLLSLRIRNMADVEKPSWYGGHGIMADSNVIYSYVLEYETPLCIVDEEAGVVQYITPIEPEDEEDRIFLWRTPGNHFKRLYPTELEKDSALHTHVFPPTKNSKPLSPEVAQICKKVLASHDIQWSQKDWEKCMKAISLDGVFD